MEPVAEITGHCFVVGARHQLRALHVGLARLCRAGSPKAVVPTGQLEKNFQGCPVGGQPRHFFLLGRIHLGAGSTGLLCRAGAALPGRFAETLGSCPPTGQPEKFFHGCRLSRQPRHFFAGKNPDLGAAMPGRRGRAMPGRFAETVGLDDSFDIFFLGRIPTLGSGLRCRAGAAGMWRARYRSLHVGVEFVTRHVGFFPTCPTAGSASGTSVLGV